MTATARKPKVQRCPECRRPTPHDEVARTVRLAAGLLPGVEWDTVQRPVMRCRECKRESKPMGIRCPSCGSGRVRVLYSRPRGPGLLMQWRQCQACGAKGIRTLVKQLR